MSVARLLAASAVAVLASLVFSGSAPAMTVYDYVYSGEYIDGTGSDKGTFGIAPSGLAYDEGNDKLLVSVAGATPTYVSKFTPAGTPDPFSGLGPGIDTIVLGAEGEEGTRLGYLSVDNSAASSAGNIYLSGSAEFWMQGFRPDGTPLAGFKQFNEQICGIGADDQGDVFATTWDGLEKYTTGGQHLETLLPLREPPDPFIKLAPLLTTQYLCRPTLDSTGNIYGNKSGGTPTKLEKLSPTSYLERYELSQNTNINGFSIDKSEDSVFVLEGNTVSEYDKDGGKTESFGPAEPGYSGLSGTPRGIAVDSATHTVWVANGRNYAGVRRVEKFVRSAPITVPTPTTVGVDSTPDSATLEGTINPDGIATADCHFEWGTTQALGNTQACAEGNVFAGSSSVSVSADIGGLVKGQTYWYRVFTKNANERVVDGGPKRFIAQGEPLLSDTFVDRVNTDGARLNTEIDPNGGRTHYVFEYGPTTAYGSTTTATRVIEFGTTTEIEKLPDSILEARAVRQQITGLTPGQEIHYRVVATNEQGTTTGPDQVFTTYLPDPATDSCSNAHVRQQVEATLLADCRAYELVSPANAGGYDVESDLIAGQTPLVSSPYAGDRALFTIHDGLVPGVSGSPTNFDRDPYVASRNASTGWSTSYVGLPADGMAQSGAFGSPLMGNDAGLDTFAFGGESICDPCFSDGSINVPLRLPDGQIVKGMAGASNPAADPTQTVLQPFSDDGSHFVFGADAKFDPLGDAGGSIYDRDLETGQTQVISNTPGGVAMTGGELGELGLSPDGSHIVIGKRLSTDAKQNDYWHLYMHVGTTPATIDLTPGALVGALYDGMSADGSRVFMSTPDKLLPEDTDLSVDVYEASVTGTGPAVLRLITTKAGVPSNDDSCSPPGIPDSWNAVSGAGRCNAVAPAGGAGVAPSTGTFFFFSPERLDGANGAQDQANMYIVKPGGGPQFVETIDSSLGKPGPQPANRPVVSQGLVTGLTTPESVAVDQSNGDIYVVEREAGRVARFTPAGAPDNFAVPGGGNTIGGLSYPFGAGTAQVAIDNAPGSPMNGRIYVASNAGVEIFASSGEKLGILTGFGLFPCGVAVDESSGVVYVGDVFASTIWRYVPTTGTTPISNANYTKTGLKTQSMNACHVAADEVGNVYATQLELFGVGPTRKFSAADFNAVPPTKLGTTLSNSSYEVTTDPATDDVYVDEGNQIKRFDSTGTFIQAFGSGSIGSTSRGVAVRASNGHVYAASSGNSIVEFGNETVPYIPIDNPAVLHGVQQSAIHSYGDFQASSTGEFAAFSSVLPLTGYPTVGHSEIYRYDSTGDAFVCVSCPVTNSLATKDASLSAYGLNLIDDGRVFFTSGESLVLRDTNEKKDAYQWTDGSVQLISTGSSPEDSGLLTASADGRDAFFFTYDTLVNEDENGSTMKIYTAREGGGFPYDPPLHPCAASDECHGPGTRAPNPPKINTVEGAGQKGAPTDGRCRKNFVKKHGKCVKKKHQKRRHRKSTHREG